MSYIILRSTFKVIYTHCSYKVSGNKSFDHIVWPLGYLQTHNSINKINHKPYPIHVSTCLHNMQLCPVAIYLDLLIFKLDSKLAIYNYMLWTSNYITLELLKVCSLPNMVSLMLQYSTALCKAKHLKYLASYSYSYINQ